MGGACSSDDYVQEAREGSDVLDRRKFECVDIVAWGSNASYQLGYVSNNDFGVAAGALHCAAVTTDGTVYTWGGGQHGRLGHGFSRSERTPRLVAALLGIRVASVACGNDFTLAQTAEGRVYSWGAGHCGQLGIGSFVQQIALPVAVDALTKPVRFIAAGLQSFAAAVDESGTLYMWGHNSAGELGLGTNINESAPKTCGFFAESERRVAAVACGYAHAAAVLENGKMYVWGEGSSGQLGQGRFNKFSSTVPVYMDTLDGRTVVACACGGAHTAAVTQEGEVWTWGNNQYGQLGVGDALDRCLPTRVHLPSAARAVAVGLSHTLCLTHDGRVFGFGANDKGQLGVTLPGGLSLATAPQAIEVDVPLSGIAASYHHSLAVHQRPLRLASHLEQFVCSSRFSDSSVVCADDVVLPVHRALVEFRCSHFFDDVHNIRSDTARIVLHYMYTDSVPVGLDSRTSAAVAAVAADLMLTRLSRLCARADRKPIAVPHGTLESDIAALAERNPHATVTVLSKQGPPGCTGHAYIVARLRSLVTQLDEGRTDIRVDDLSAAALRVLWQYLYSEWCVDGALWDVLELMQWAERHFEDELARACEDCLLRLEITPESLHGLAAAGQTGVGHRVRACVRFFCREHRDEVQEWLQLLSPDSGSAEHASLRKHLEVEEHAAIDRMLQEFLDESAQIAKAEQEEKEDPTDTREKRKHVNLRAGAATTMRDRRKEMLDFS